MIDKYPNFLPQWTNAMCHIHNDKRLFLINKYDRSNTMKEATKHFSLDWYSGSCCLTGEAFFHQYAPAGCPECRAFTMSRSQRALKSLDNLYVYKVELAEHLQQDHPETWNAWKDRL